MAESYPNRYKTLREKEKLLVTSNFSFSHSVFKRLVSQGRQKVSLCGNGLIPALLYGDYRAFDPSPNNNILDWSKLKAACRRKFQVLQKMNFDFAWVGNNVRKRENYEHQHFLLCTLYFQILSLSGALKLGIVWYRVKKKNLISNNSLQMGF